MDIYVLPFDTVMVRVVSVQLFIMQSTGRGLPVQNAVTTKSDARVVTYGWFFGSATAEAMVEMARSRCFIAVLSEL